jgi:hypothetical protein
MAPSALAVARWRNTFAKNSVNSLSLISPEAIANSWCFTLPRPLDVDLGCLETGYGDVEVEIELQEALKLDGEQLAVPARVFGELVVGDDIGANLGVREVLEADRRHAFQTKQLGRLDAPMAGDDTARAIYQNWVCKPEPLYTGGDLADLLLGHFGG